MSRGGRALLLGALALAASGCASTGGVQVSRVPRTGAAADTARWHDVVILPQPDHAGAHTAMQPAPARETRPSQSRAARGATPKPATAKAPPPAVLPPSLPPVATRDTLAPVSQPLSVEAAVAPAQSDADDPFDTMFTDAGRVEDVGDSGLIAEDAPRDSPRSTPPPIVPTPAPVVREPGARDQSRAAHDDTPPPQTPPRVRAPVIAPKPGSEPAPRTPAVSTDDAEPAGRSYAVQLHAFPTRVAAEFAARQAARALGVEARVREQPSSSLPFKVVAGHYATRAAATELRERAVRGGFPEAWVVVDTDSTTP